MCFQDDGYKSAHAIIEDDKKKKIKGDCNYVFLKICGLKKVEENTLKLSVCLLLTGDRI